MSPSVWLLLAAATAGFAAAWLVLELRRAWSPDALRHEAADDPEIVEYLRSLEGDVTRLDREVKALHAELDALRAHTEPLAPPPRVEREPDAPPAPAREIYQTRPLSDPERTRLQMVQLQEYLDARERGSEPS